MSIRTCLLITMPGRGIVGKLRYGPLMARAAPRYTAPYWMVEHSLVRTFAIGSGNLTAFRSRIGELQRGGIFGAENQPGKGTKLVYSADQFCRLVFALSLAQFGLAPTLILRVVRDYWATQLEPIFRKAVREFGLAYVDTTQNNDIVLVFGIRVVTEGAVHAVPMITSCELYKLPQRVELTFQDAEPRLMINVTERMRKFYAALSEVHLSKEPQIARKKK